MINSNLYLQITVKANDRYDVDLGSLRLHNGGKSYFMDIINSYSDTDEDGTIVIGCELEYDEEENMEIFEDDSEFDLEDEDLFSDGASATVWVEGEEDFEIISMVLTITNQTLGNKVIQCTEE